MASLFAVRRVAGHPRAIMRVAVTRKSPAPWLMTVLLGVGCASSAGQKAGAQATASVEDARQLYPLDAGWKWAYDVEKAGQPILAVYSVIQRQGVTAVLQAGEERITYLVLPDGIARRGPDKDLPHGDYLLHSPIRVGARWPIEGGTATVASVGQTVTVPAGTYQGCVVVEESRSEPTRLVRTTYAPGTGPVTIEFLVHDAASGRFEPALRASLRGVTSPGSDPLN
jgi:hypothetical protein